MSVKGLTQRNNYDTSRKVLSKPRVIDNTIQNQMNKYMHTLEHNKKMLESRQSKVGLVSLKNGWRRQQDKLNYQSEYDRIRGLLESSVLKGNSTTHLKNKQKQLENMEIVGMRPSKAFDIFFIRLVKFILIDLFGK